MSQEQRDTLHRMLREGPLDLGGDLSEQRPLLDQLMTAHPLPADVTTTPGELGGVRVVHVELARGGSAGVLLYLHSGAYALGSAAAAAGLAAGAGLAVAMLLASRAAGLPPPAAAVLLSPWVDLTLSGASTTAKAAADPALTAEGLHRRAVDYVAGGNPTDPLVSPLFADLTGLPPLLVQVGSSEILLDDATRLTARAAAADVAVTLQVTPGVPHVFQGFAATLQEGDAALDHAGAFLRSHLHADSPARPAGRRRAPTRTRPSDRQHTPRSTTMPVVLITGAGTGIGNLTARALAAAGHTVYASMRDPGGRNADRARALLHTATTDGVDLRVVELDVRSQDSADAAVRTVLDQAGQLDVVIHNAGHLFVGYVEAFTAEDIARLFDTNALGAHRLNRSVLPHMRERGSGTLLYVGSTIPITTPPFLGPYVASKAAMDALALTTSYEVGQFGVETVIVMPGAFTQGTEHFADASRADDAAVTAAYADLDPLVARNEDATSSLFRPGVDAHPVSVADEITRILALPVGGKPFRSVIDFTDSGVDHVNSVIQDAREDFVVRMGFGRVLHLQPSATQG